MSETGPPWSVTYTVWNETEDGRERTQFSGFFNEPTKIDCVNAIVYDIRGDKSKWELGYVNEIKPAGESDE